MIIESEVLNDFPRFFSVLIDEFTASGAVDIALKVKRDMIIENLDLKPQINAIVRNLVFSEVTIIIDLTSLVAVEFVVETSLDCFDYFDLRLRSRQILHSSNPKSCLKVLRAQLKEFFDLKKVKASYFQNKSWQEHFKDNTSWEPETYKRILLRYLEELDKLIDERVLKYGELRVKVKEFQAIEEIEKWPQESKMQKQEILVTEGAIMEACLVNEDESSSSETIFSRSENENISFDYESNSSGNDADAKKLLVYITASEIENADIRPSYDSDTVYEVSHDMFEKMFENMMVHGIQNHVQAESIPDTYVVNENNSNIISDIPNMDPDREKEEYDYVDYEQQRAFYASLINNLKCDVEKCNKTLRMLLPKEDNVNTGKQGVDFENQNDNVNPSVLNKSKKLYNVDEMGKDELSDHKIISEEELKCEAEKRLKVKQRKSPLSYHGFVYAETQFEEPPKFPFKKKKC
ncbi:hypothetical protein Tco_0026891 [Tanacetum coccineum]